MQFAFSAMLFSSSSMHKTSAEDSARGTPEKFPKDAMRGKFKAPIWWLATLLLRCDTDNLPGVFGLLREIRLLGGIVADAAVKDIAGIAELEKDSAYLLCPDKTPPADELKLPHRLHPPTRRGHADLGTDGRRLGMETSGTFILLYGVRVPGMWINTSAARWKR